ncbi:hypothetical protein [Pseudomonas sp. S2_E01]
MSDNSLENLLTWLKETSRMLDWGLIFALDRQKSNLLIRQEYINRFGAGSFIKPISGEVELVEGKYVERIQNFMLSVPVLSFANTGLNDSKAQLTMNVMGGDQITLAQDGDGWNAIKVEVIDPLQSPELTLMLLLADVPGEISVEGRVRLDLKHSDQFFLTFANTDHAKRLGGEFFHDYFKQLPDEQRVYPLGEIKRGSNVLMDPQSFELRTQAISPAAWDRSSQEFGEGCIVVLVRTMARHGGNYPGDGYRYLLAHKQGVNYSASVLFDRRRAAGDTLLNEVTRLVNGGGYNFNFSDHGQLISAVIKSGSLELPSSGGSTFLPGHPSLFVWIFSKMHLSGVGEGALTVRFDDNNVVIEWAPVSVTRITLTPLGSYPLVLDAEILIELRIEYELRETDGEIMLEQVAMDVGLQFGKVVEVENPAEMDEPTRNILLGFVMGQGVYASLLGYLKVAFAELVKPEGAINDYLQQTIRLNFGRVISGTEFFAPNDILHVAHINPIQTSFEISPMQSLLRQGTTLQLSTVPVAQGAQWKVENVTGETANPGTISNTGLYQAPVLDERYLHVRVTATADDGKYSVALLTVVQNELNVNPRIQTCDVGKSVELRAGSLGTGARQWKIKNPVSGESGQLRPSDVPGGDHTYEHGPVVPKKTFVLDEIEVTTANGPAQSVHVLALQKKPALTVKVVNFDLGTREVQLEAISNGDAYPAEWSVALGPGTIDANGLYTAPATTTEHFVLIFAAIDSGMMGWFEGFMILSLPLHEFPAVLSRITR